MKGGLPHENDFLFFEYLNDAPKQVVFVDVGANAGQSVISFLMSCPTGRVISFEPNLLYKPVLEGIRELVGARRFDFRMCGLSDIEGELDLFIPLVDGWPYMQEASVNMDQFEKPWVRDRLLSYGKEIAITTTRAKFDIGDRLIEQADVVKIDAEGAEMSVLRGLRTHVEGCAPIFMIENNDYFAVTDFLVDKGYGVYQFNEEVGLQPMSGATTNCFYLKAEHFSSFDLPFRSERGV